MYETDTPMPTEIKYKTFLSLDWADFEDSFYIKKNNNILFHLGTLWQYSLQLQEGLAVLSHQEPLWDPAGKIESMILL